MEEHEEAARADEETYLTVDEVGAKLRVHPATIRRLIKAGQIPAIRIGSQYRVPTSFKILGYKPAHRETA